MPLKNLLKISEEEFQFAVHGELKDWRELHTTAAMRFGRSTALSQIAFATLRQLRIAANVTCYVRKTTIQDNDTF
jgi:hypothetical protein